MVGVDRHNYRQGAAARYYAGLGVSLEATAICVIDEAGEIVRGFRAESEPGALNDALMRLDLPLAWVGWRRAR